MRWDLEGHTKYVIYLSCLCLPVCFPPRSQLTSDSKRYDRLRDRCTRFPCSSPCMAPFVCRGRSEPFEHGNVSGDALTIFPITSNERQRKPMHYHQPLSLPKMPRCNRGLIRWTPMDQSCLTRSRWATQGPTARTHCSGGAGLGEPMDSTWVDRAPMTMFRPRRIHRIQ